MPDELEIAAREAWDAYMAWNTIEDGDDFDDLSETARDEWKHVARAVLSTGVAHTELVEQRDGLLLQVVRLENKVTELRESIERIGYRILEGSFTRPDGSTGRFYLYRPCGETLHTADVVYECTLESPHPGDRHLDQPKNFSW